MTSVQGWAVVGPDGEVMDVFKNSGASPNNFFGIGYTVKPATIATECRWELLNMSQDYFRMCMWRPACTGESHIGFDYHPKHCSDCGGKVVVDE